MRKNQKPYIPRTNLSDPQQIRKMLGSMIDIYDHGLDLGNKRIVRSNTKSKLNSLFYRSRKPKTYHIDPATRRFYRREKREQAQRRQNSTLKSEHIYEHINRLKKRYYTSDPLSPIMMQGWDTDNNTSDPERVVPFYDFFNRKFSSFSDSGSSGKSLHNFPKFNMVPLYEYHEDLSFDNKTNLSWAKYANNILSKVSYIIKNYGQTIIAPEYKIVINKKNGKMNREYFAAFDAIKGTYPDYKYNYYRDNNDELQYVITGINFCGTFVKLPNLFTSDDVLHLASSPVYSILDLLTWSIHLVNELLLCCSVVPSSQSVLTDSNNLSFSIYINMSYDLKSGSSCCSYSSFLSLSDKQVRKLLSISDELETILKAHNICFPSVCRGKNAVASNKTEIGSDTLLLNEEREKDYKDYVYMPGHFSEEKEKPHFQGKNKENLKSINEEQHVIKRSTRYLYYLYMKYALGGKELTDFEEYRHNYRADAGTGEETEANVRRLKYVWDNNIDRMKKYIHGGLKGRIDTMEEKINKITTQEEIHNLRDKYSSFIRNIYPRDVAAAALWISATLTNETHLEMKQWTATGASNLNQNKELTAPMVAMERFLDKLKEKDILKNGSDHKKTKALREILIHMGWIECVDDSYDFVQAHRSMRYVLTDKHPYYKEFEQAIGIDTIQYWKNITKQNEVLNG